jgi:hypothetical protein
MDALPARLTVHRRSPEDEGERQLFVSVDGERLGMLGFGRQLSRALEPGEHRLRIHNTFWWKTVRFEVRPGDDVHFGAVNLTPGCMVGFAAAMGAAPMFVRIIPMTSAEAASPAADSSLAGKR